jgi:hypothetical protein
MKTLLSALVFLVLALPTIAQDAPKAASPITGQIEVFFSPKGGCTEAVAKQIDVTQKTIHDGFAFEEFTDINAIPNKHDVETAQRLLKKMTKENWVKQCAKEADATAKPKRVKQTAKRK